MSKGWSEREDSFQRRWASQRGRNAGRPLAIPNDMHGALDEAARQLEGSRSSSRAFKLTTLRLVRLCDLEAGPFDQIEASKVERPDGAAAEHVVKGVHVHAGGNPIDASAIRDRVSG